eukprot:Amastigsp_a343922_8.p6 type:complete len:100 gc:universal Amastigsp_a343922_8:273-572(+)
MLWMTSTRPGRMSAGSRRPMWFVVMNSTRSSDDATPSRVLSSPEKVSRLSELVLTRVASGNAASMSSRRTIVCWGTAESACARRSSVMPRSLRFRIQIP